MRVSSSFSLLSYALVSSLCLVSCGDSEQEPTGPTGAGTTTTSGNGGATTTTTGTGGVGGSGGMTGGGGSGGTTGCITAGDCGISDDCHLYSCEAGMCIEVFPKYGTNTKAQTPGDCLVSICDGAGAIIQDADDTDVPDDQNDCTTDSCDAGTAVHEPLASGDTCASNGGKVCDGAGSCVECVVSTDCTPGICDATNQCVGALCMNNQKDVSETDVDCGGAQCSPCGDGKMCLLGTDCTSGVCDPMTLVCSAPTCQDTVKNGMETGVDCGGPACPTCADGEACASAADCTGGFCLGPPICQSSLNGCTMAAAEDHTADDVTIVTQMGFAYSPSCIVIKAGKQVTISSNFVAHPLTQGAVVGGMIYPEAGGPIPHTQTGTTATFTFPDPGEYGYYCDIHYPAGMFGAVFVVP